MTRTQGWIAGAGATFVLGLALVATGPGCAKPGPFTADNVLVVTVGGMRADRVGWGGDPDARTPGWDRLAREGAPFRTTISPSPVTLPAIASLLGGVEPRHHHARTDFGEVAQTEETLAHLLRGVGMETAGFSGAAEPARETGIAAGFDRFETADETADDVAGNALAWVDALGDRDHYFLYLHLADPARAASAGAYRSAVAATDRALLRFLHAMESDGRLDRTMIVATADHGIAFGEHGEYGSGAYLYDTTIRVPLVVWGPLPFRGGAVRDDLSRTIDVLPTVLEATRVATAANRPGRALQLPMKPFRERALAAIAETFPEPGREGELRALRTATTKYVFGEGDSEALFDLVADPGEETNLVQANPREAAREAAAMSADLQKALGDDLARPRGL